MIYIDINRLEHELPDGWLAKADELLRKMLDAGEDKVARNSIIEKNERMWKDLKNGLKKLSYGKCWYSEAREIYSHYHVDHFRPKIKSVDVFQIEENRNRDGYWWLAFKWNNYRLSGGVGNTKKGNHFAVKQNCASSLDDEIDDEIIYFLDPTQRNDYKKLSINENGQIGPANQNEEAWDHIRAKYTVDYLDLNFESLEEARKIKWKRVKMLIDKIDIAEAEYNQNPTAKKLGVLEEKLETMRNMLAPCEELSSTVRACLRASKKDWALALLEEQISVEEFCSDFIIPEEKEEDNVN